MIQDLLKEFFFVYILTKIVRGPEPPPPLPTALACLEDCIIDQQMVLAGFECQNTTEKKHKELGRLSLQDQLSPCSAAQLAQFCQTNKFKKSTATKSLLQQNSMKIEIGHQHQWICRVYGCFKSKIQQTKILVIGQRCGDLFSFGLVWPYSSNQKQYNLGRFKVSYLLAAVI